MTDIEKLLTEAGWQWDESYKAWMKQFGTRMPSFTWKFQEGAWSATLFFPETALEPLLLSLQGRAALTEEERNHIEWAALELEFNAELARLKGNKSLHDNKLANAKGLRNLLTRSTADVVSLEDVEEAMLNVLRRTRVSCGEERFIACVLEHLTTALGEGEK